MTRSKTFLIAAPLALAAGAVMSTPAAATPWSSHDRLLAEMSQLDIQIDRAAHNGWLSRSEGRELQREVSNLVRLYDRFAYGGFNRGELNSLNRRLENIEYAFEQATRGYARNSRYDRYDRYARDDRRDRDDRYDRRNRDQRNGWRGRPG